MNKTTRFQMNGLLTRGLKWTSRRVPPDATFFYQDSLQILAAHPATVKWNQCSDIVVVL